MSATLVLKKGGLKPLAQGHPWVFAQSVGRLHGRARPGEVVRLVDADDRFLAWAWFSPESHIRARVLERREKVFPDDAWLAAQLAAALDRRRELGLTQTQAYRLVNAEADGLPGLIVDRYGDGLVVQALSAGAEAVKFTVAGWLKENLTPAWIWERSDQEVRKLEGLDPWAGPLFGQAPERVRLTEEGVAFIAQPLSGQKTGFFLDQRDNRRLVASLARGREMLDCFCYGGGFAVRALMGGAKNAILADSSVSALELARDNLEANGVGERAELVKANVFDLLRAYREQKRRFDLIVLDPPKLAPTKASLPQATRAYKDVNMGGLRLLAPGGILATFSCSAGMDMASFQEMLLWAAEDTGRRCQVLHAMGQPPDHPHLLGFPESHYLKGLILRVL
jgi:23S rRNA (cytosine1962-C5)-methyltransferase